MDIKVGRTNWTLSTGKVAGRTGAWIEAKLLALRTPRQKPRGAEGAKGQVVRSPRDPLNSRVMLLMIPDVNELPDDLSPEKYRALVRLVKR